MFTHLGNVRATFADKRLASVNGGSIDDYSIDVTSWSDYYAFGAQMPKRNDNPGDYRYGFNGMEKDDEVKDAVGKGGKVSGYNTTVEWGAGGLGTHRAYNKEYTLPGPDRESPDRKNLPEKDRVRSETKK